MCGLICGNNFTDNQQFIDNALNAIAHRGPDAKNTSVIDECFLAHVRLAIVDIEHGHQPIYNENKTICACVNGEFYDYQKLQTFLINKGHRLLTNSDSEILVHLYEEYGTGCLEFLHGEFAFALYDSNKKQWFCARDRFGVRPLQFYFNSKDNQFLISSEAKAILEFKNIQTAFNKNAFWFAQHLQYLPPEQTLFENIHMIKPAHYMILSNNVPKQFEYWNLNNIQKQQFTFEDAKENIQHLLQQSVVRRIPNQVKMGTHLSGGVDSGIVNSLAKKQTNDFSAYCIQFTDDNFYNEYDSALKSAQFLDINLISIPVSFEQIISNIPNAIYHSEGLSINGHLGAKYILNEEMKKHGVKVALSGEGADEIFMGYSHLKQDFLTKNSLLNAEKQYLTGFQLPDKNSLDTSIIEKQIGFTPTWIQAKASMAYKLSSLWHEDFSFSTNPYETIAIDLKNNFHSQSKLQLCARSWSKYCLSGYILKVLDDAQAMAHSIEGRLPFLDTDLVQFMAQIPDDLYFHKNIEKGLLRSTFENHLPQEILHKMKQSFMSPPINRFIQNEEFKNQIMEFVIENQTLKNLALFDHQKLEKFFFDKSTTQTNTLEPIVMTILSTGIFVNKFLK